METPTTYLGPTPLVVATLVSTAVLFASFLTAIFTAKANTKASTGFAMLALMALGATFMGIGLCVAAGWGLH